MDDLVVPERDELADWDGPGGPRTIGRSPGMSGDLGAPPSLTARLVQRLNALLARGLDGKDPHIPLLSWWAVEKHAITGRERVLRLFGGPEAWKLSMVREVILERLIRRYASEGTEAGDEA